GVAPPRAPLAGGAIFNRAPPPPAGATTPPRTFGNGPGHAQGTHDDSGPNEMALLAGIGGAALVAAAVALWRGSGPLRMPRRLRTALTGIRAR
ncbi:type VII secretion-associated serine protease mycosin, partial [Streptomyces sp. NPDC127074]